MSQFDVHRIPSRRGGSQYVVDLQADILDELATRLVAPLRRLKSREDLVPRLTPTVEVNGEPHFIVLSEIAAVRLKELGTPIDNLRSHRDEIIAAIDILFTGI
jgi:toxin CcdB